MYIDDIYQRFAEKVREMLDFDEVSVILIDVVQRTVSQAYCTRFDVSTPGIGETTRARGEEGRRE